MSPRIALALVLLGTAMLTLGGLFKVLHWPTANIQLLLGSSVQITALFVLTAHVLHGRVLKEAPGR